MQHVQAFFVFDDDRDVRVPRGPGAGTDDELVADLVPLGTAGDRCRTVKHFARGDAAYHPRDAAYVEVDKRGDWRCEQ